MVKIEFLPSEFTRSDQRQTLDDLIHQPCFNKQADQDSWDDTNIIVELAKACAAVQIQAVWRGIRIRKQKYCNKPKKSLQATGISLCHEAALAIQKAWKTHRHNTAINTNFSRNNVHSSASKSTTVLSVHVTTQTEVVEDHKRSVEHVPNEDWDAGGQKKIEAKIETNSSRREVIQQAYDSCCSRLQDGVHINGFDVINILQAMTVLLPREYEILSKALLNDNKVIKSSTKIQFFIRLKGSLIDFEEDMNAARLHLIQRARELNPTSAIYLRKKCAKSNLTSSAESARSHLQKLCALSDDLLLILERNENIMLYDDVLIGNFLSCIGIDMCETQLDGTKSLLDYLELQLEQVEDSFLQNRIETAISLVHFVVEWEKTSSTDPGLLRHTGLPKTPDLNVTKLQDELQRLKQKLASMECHRCRCCRQESEYSRN